MPTPRSRHPAVSPVTPHATEAQEVFLAELQDLLGATQAGGGGAPAGAAEGGASSGGGSGAAAGAGAAVVAGSEAAYWKGMFEELSAMRNTVPEEQLKLFKEHAAERDLNAEKYIQQLRCVFDSPAQLLCVCVCVFFCCSLR